MSGVLQDEHFLLREFSSPVLLHQHLPSVLIGSGRCHIGNYISSRTRQLKGHNKAKSDSFDGYFAFLRSRDCALGRNIDILKHLNYAKYYSILSQALPNTLSIYVRTSEVSATLFSAAMVKSFVTNLADVMSCAAVDGFMKSTLSAARDYADAGAAPVCICPLVYTDVNVVCAYLAMQTSTRPVCWRFGRSCWPLWMWCRPLLRVPSGDSPCDGSSGPSIMPLWVRVASSTMPEMKKRWMRTQ